VPARRPPPTPAPEPEGLRRFLPHAGIVAGLALAGWALFGRTSEEDRIRAKLDELAEAVAVRGVEPNLVLRGARIRRAFGELFVQNVAIRVPELTSVDSGRAELVGLATQAVQLYEHASVDLSGLRIEIDAPKASAMAHGEASLSAVRHGGTREMDTRTVALRFDKLEGDWRIVSVSVSDKRTPK
jgi:phosphoribosylformylglycinamidine synthase